MDKRGLEDLIGRTIDRRYKLISLIRQTSKSWVFEAIEEGELSPHRKVAIKILKPGLGREREDQFSREVDRLANLEEHPNITTLYGAGRDGRYFYVAMELVPGKDLDQEIKSGKTFSLEEILDIIKNVSEASSHIHEKADRHHDIKLKNIKVREEKIEEKVKKTYVLDLGGRLKITKDSNDVYAMGNILKELLDHQKDDKQKIFKGLEQIVEKSKSSDGYVSPEDFKNAIENYRKSAKRGIFRRKFLKIVIGGLVLSGLVYSGYRHLNHINSIDHIVDCHKNIPANNYKAMNKFLVELRDAIIKDKIFRPLKNHKFLSKQAELNPEPLAPFAVDKNDNWFPYTKNERSGDFVNILLKASLFNQKYVNYTIKCLDKILNQEISEKGILKFYYSMAFASEVETLPDDERNLYKEKALEAADFLSDDFNKVSGYSSSIYDMEKALLTLWAVNNSKENKKRFNSQLENIVDNFTNYNILEKDNKILVFPYVEFDNKIKRYVLNPLNEKTIAFTEDNYLMVARHSARLIQIYSLLSNQYRETDHQKSSEYFEIAEKLANQHLSDLNGSNYFLGIEKGPIDNTYYVVLAKSIATLLNYNPNLENNDYLIDGMYGLTRELTLPKNLRKRNEQGMLYKIYSRIKGAYGTSWIYADKNLFDIILLIPNLNKENKINKLITIF